MIEPTLEFRYTFLNALQSFAGLKYNTAILENIYKLYTLRKAYPNDAKIQNKLTQAFYYLVSLQEDKAQSLLNEIEIK